MFHDGDLQSGIARAVQESKSVLCFINDDSDEAGQWEQWLVDEQLALHVQQQAVVLRLQAGSQEAGFLAAFCPVTSTPALILIYQGQLREQLNSGIEKDEFTSRVLRAIEHDTSPPIATSEPMTATIPSNETVARATPASGITPSLPTTPVQQQAAQPPPRQEPSPRIQSLLQERGQRLEAMRLAREQNEKAAAAERAKARKQKEAEKAATKPSASSTSSIGKDRSYEAEQVKRKREAKADRERILKQIENDKIARKEREERRRAAARTMQDGEAEEAPHSELSSMPSRASTTTTGTTCALQIRLPSEGSVRNTFPATATIAKDIRPWIASEASPECKNTAYTFKLIQTPQPSKSISDGEEAQTLQDLGLIPSATLVMVPARGSVAGAYPGDAIGGVSGLLHKIINLIVAAFMWVVAAFRAFAGPSSTVPTSAGPEGRSTVGVAGGPFRSGAIEAAIARRQEREDAAAAASATNAAASGKTSSSSSAAVSAGSTTGIRIRTLRDQVDEGESRQFYNGNQLSFEPRKDDDVDEGTR